MSGGSYNYLCLIEDNADIQNKIEYLHDMIATLQDVAPLAAQESEKLLDNYNAYRTGLNESLGRLRPIWKAVEWWESNDWGRDSVDKAYQTYLNNLPKVQPSMKNTNHLYPFDFSTSRDENRLYLSLHPSEGLKSVLQVPEPETTILITLTDAEQDTSFSFPAFIESVGKDRKGRLITTLFLGIPWDYKLLQRFPDYTHLKINEPSASLQIFSVNMEAHTLIVAAKDALDLIRVLSGEFADAPETIAAIRKAEDIPHQEFAEILVETGEDEYAPLSTLYVQGVNTGIIGIQKE